MRALGPRHHHSDIRRLQQGQIIGGVPKAQHPHAFHSQTLLQHRQSPALAHPGPQQMGHAVALHDGQIAGGCQLLQPGSEGRRRWHERDTAAAALGLKQTIAGQPQEPITLRGTELIQSPQRLPQVIRQLLQLRLELSPCGPQGLVKGLAVNRPTVLHDVGIPQPRFGAEPLDLFGRLAGAGNHGNPALAQTGQGLSRRRPVIAMVHESPIQIGHHPPRRSGHDGINQCTA